MQIVTLLKKACVVLLKEKRTPWIITQIPGLFLRQLVRWIPGLRYKEVCRGSIRIRIRNATVDSKVVLQIFDEDEYSILRTQIPLNGVVIDVGAHIGCFTLLAATRVKEGRVYSIEPDPENYSLLVHNVLKNNLKNVMAFRIGMAAKCGVRTLHFHLENWSHSIVNTSDYTGHRSIDCICLNHFFREHRIVDCHLLKLDCEGAEFEILRAASFETLSRIQRIVGEWHIEHQSIGEYAALIAHLERNGFEVNPRQLNAATHSKGKFIAFRTQCQRATKALA